MKTKVAMAISLAGVLAAGTAAALVNTQVLNGGSSGGGLADAAAAEQTIPTTIVTSAADQSLQPSSTIAEQPAVAPSPTQAVYAIGDAGTVTLDTAGDVLTIVATSPAPGWAITQSEVDDGRNAEVKIAAGNVEVEFHANLLYGVVNTSFETHDLSAPNSSVSGGEDEGGDDGGLQSGVDDGGYEDD